MPAREHGRPNLITGAEMLKLAGSLAIGGGGGEGGGGGGGGAGICTIGESGSQRGYFENNAVPPVALFGAITNNTPVPPVGSLRLRAILQNGVASGWQIRITPAIFVQSDWTSCAISGLNGGITLLSANATFTANSFGASLWSFGNTIDVWGGLSAGSMQTYEFA